MKIDDQLNELKSAWQSSAPPDVADIAKRARRARWRGRATVALEFALTTVGILVGIEATERSGWFATAIGIVAVVLCVAALVVSVVIRYRSHVPATDSVRGQLRVLMGNARTNLKLVSAGYWSCLVALAFVAFMATGSVLGLPGAPARFAPRAMFAIGFLAAFVLISRWYQKRTEKHLARLADIEASLSDD